MPKDAHPATKVQPLDTHRHTLIQTPKHGFAYKHTDTLPHTQERLHTDKQTHIHTLTQTHGFPHKN